jgi:hypothetical protein
VRRNWPASGESDEGIALRASQVKAVGQELDRIAAWAMDRATLQVADQASANTGAFRQLLLGQVTGESQPLELVTEGQECGLPSRLLTGSHDVSLYARATPD